MSKIASALTILAALVLSTFLLTSCLPGPEATTATSSPTANEDTTTESTTQSTVPTTESSITTTQIETTEPTTSETATSVTTAATTTSTTSATNEIRTLTGTFQSYVWGDFLHVDILGDDGVLYSFFVINCDSEVDVETLTSGQKVTVTWQNIDKELPIGDTKEIHNIDELLTLELVDD